MGGVCVPTFLQDTGHGRRGGCGHFRTERCISGGGGRENEMGGATTRVRPVDMHMMCNVENSDG